MSKSFKAAMQQSVNIRPENWVNNFPDNQDQDKNNKKDIKPRQNRMSQL